MSMRKKIWICRIDLIITWAQFNLISKSLISVGYNILNDGKSCLYPLNRDMPMTELHILGDSFC